MTCTHTHRMRADCCETLLCYTDVTLSFSLSFPLSFPLSFSLSLSLTHNHTHTHTQKVGGLPGVLETFGHAKELQTAKEFDEQLADSRKATVKEVSLQH